MTPRGRWTVIGLSIAALACSDIAAPLRSDFYEWRLFPPSASGTGVDTLSFHWPPNRLPVRVWVEDRAGLPEDMDRAITTWKEEFLHREFDAIRVSDSAAADVIVRAAGAPSFQRSRLRLLSALADQCTGATDLAVSDDHRQLLLPVRIFIDPGFDQTIPGLEECLALTSIHELGHALGIFQHSTNPADIMFFNPVVALPSARDRATAEILYHLPSTLEAVGP